MGTIGSSLNSQVTAVSSMGNSSSNSSSSGGLSTGSSSYSKDLQGSASRAVQIASLPIMLMQGQQTYLDSQSTELTTIDGLFSKLQNAVQGIQIAMTGSAFDAAISNTAVVSAKLADGAVEGVYSIEVEDIGAYASSITKTGWNSTETVEGTPEKYNLVVGQNLYPVTPDNDDPTSVAAAINSLYGNLVNATVVNVSSNDTPVYEISLLSTTLGDVNLDIQTSAGVSLQQPQNPGGSAQYIIDNSGTLVASDSRNVKISDGVTLQLLSSDPGEPVDVTVTRLTLALSNALSAFADAYNAVVKEVRGQRGQSGGALQGSTILTQLQRALGGIATYTAAGQVSGLRDLGLSLNDDGTFTYDQWALYLADIGSSTAVSGFIGSADSGFLKSVNASLSNVEDSTTGLLKNAETAVQSQLTALGDKMAAKQLQVDKLQTDLTKQMAAADAMISSIEQQYQVISGMFSAMDAANKAYAS